MTHYHSNGVTLQEECEHSLTKCRHQDCVLIRKGIKELSEGSVS